MKVLITGITGTLGQEVTKQLLESSDCEIIGYSRDELKQSQLPFKDDRRITLYLGDVRDRNRLIEASRGVDTLFHFAALKRVESLEENPEECIETNIRGTQNVLAAQRYNSIKRVVLSSTDKACEPINVYGMSKGLAERLVLRNKNNVVCRYGNVLASRGSAVPIFIEKIKYGDPVPITDLSMTRFFIRIEDAARFVIKSSFLDSGGLNVPEMKSCYMFDLATAIGKILNKDFTTTVVGMRPGEKIFECLKTKYEGEPLYSDSCTQFTAEELIQLIKPIVESLK